MSSVRVRFAPSPTGNLHIGNIRTAILNWIFAKKHQGTFVLRIEDSDAERSTRQSEQSILHDLTWLGLTWDEGPDNGGKYGPYRQSDRLAIYQEHLRRLQEMGKVYPCCKSDVALEKIRKTAIERGDPAPYIRKNLEASESELQVCACAGKQPGWLFEVTSGEIKWQDLVKGELAFDGRNVADFVVVRSNGLPTYNFAAAIDDALMEITHVIRGDDHVSNTPKQILIFEALSFSLPRFGHIPMILGADRTRLSKRHGATSVEEFKESGYLPEALINFLSLLSWSSESGEEILSRDRLIDEFSFERMSKSPAIFDTTKLNWMNGQYIRNLSGDKFKELAAEYLGHIATDASKQEVLTKALNLLQTSIDYLGQLPELVQPFFVDQMQPTEGEAIAISSRDSSQKVYWAFLRNLGNYDHLDANIFRNIMKEVQQESGIMGKDLWMPVRVALSGRTHGPDLAAIAEILGKAKAEKFVRQLVD